MSKRSDFFVDTVVDVLECGTLWAGVVLRSPPCWINTEIVSSLLFSPAAPCLGSEEVDCWDLGVVVLFLCDSFESWGGKNRSTRNPSVTASRRTSSSAFRGICVTAMTNRDGKIHRSPRVFTNQLWRDREESYQAPLKYYTVITRSLRTSAPKFLYKLVQPLSLVKVWRETLMINPEWLI